MSKIHIYFMETMFEHDVFELIRAFYPEADFVSVYEAPPARILDQIEKEIEQTQLKQDIFLGHLKKQEEDAAQLPDDKNDICFIVDREGDFHRIRSLSKKEIFILTSGLIPDSDGIDIVGDEDAKQKIRLRIRKENKDRVKTGLYRMLVKMSGKELPWGSLTGIRPVKLASDLLAEGRKNKEIAGIFRERYQVSAKKTALAVTIANREKEITKNIDPEKGYSLYLGIPFCPSICLYCSFSSYPISVYHTKVEAYLKALYREIEAMAFQMAETSRTLDTIYIGGGTPTTLSAAQLDGLLDHIGRCFGYDGVKEFTVEAGRPDSIDREKLKAMRHYPVSRISVNPQTMNQKTLDLIGRHHTVDQIREAFRLAREEGFDDINMDIIIGLPGEGKDEVSYTLEEIAKLSPDSLTVHTLAVKRAARLNIFRDQLKELTFETSQEIMDETMEAAYRMGMAPYYLYRQKNMKGNFENVGYAKEGKAGLYNILIMEEIEPILALGAGGASKLVLPYDSRIERVENVKDVNHYIERVDEMIERKKKALPLLEPKRRMITFDLISEIRHGIQVSNLAYAVGKEYGLEDDECYELAIAGMVHDIGKLRLRSYISGNEQDPMVIEELKYMRMHSALGYEALEEIGGYSDSVLQTVLYHHENYDGSGYPDNLSGEQIPIGARILRVCDVYCALISDRPYRKAFDAGTVMELMIEEVKNFDMGVFLAFQRVIHDKDTINIRKE